MSYQLKQGKHYALLELDLSDARENQPIFIPGDTLAVLYLDGELMVRLDDPKAPEIDLTRVSRLNVRPEMFSFLYFTNPAQSGKKAIILVGREAAFQPVPARIGNVGLLNASETRINPATEDTLVQVLEKVSALFNSIGDAGDNPSNMQGYTLLYTADKIWQNLIVVRNQLGRPMVRVLLTDTPLDAEVAYVSSAYDMREVTAGFITAAAYADVDGTLYIEQSWDSTHWDFEDHADLTGPGTAYLKVPLKARFVRVRYVNGPTAQSEFRLGVGVTIA